MDMDGILYHGNSPVPGAIEFLQHFQNLPTAFITNNPIKTPQQVAEKLQRMGFNDIDSSIVITSAMATAQWLGEQKKDFKYFAVGAPGLDFALREFGSPDPDNADYVVVGEGPGLDYETLTTGINLILKRDATLVSTNPDNTVDDNRNGHHVVLPGGGALVSPFVVATGKKPVTIGKPEPLLYEMALQILKTSPASCLMIGDRPDTDIAGAESLGMLSALVRTGRFAPGDELPENMSPPDFDCDNLFELAGKLESTFPGWLDSH